MDAGARTVLRARALAATIANIYYRAIYGKEAC